MKWVKSFKSDSVNEEFIGSLITDDKKLKIVSNKVTSSKFEKEMKKPEDERKVSTLFEFEKIDTDAFGPKNWSDLKKWSGEDKFKGE